MSVDGKNIIEASMNWEENECYDDKKPSDQPAVNVPRIFRFILSQLMLSVIKSTIGDTLMA